MKTASGRRVPAGTRAGLLGLAMLLATMAASSCGSKQETPPQGRDTGLTGILSEEKFKALHELRTDQAPPARGQMIEIANSAAYLSLPEDAQPPLPGILVIHEWWGLNDNIKHWTDRLAADGYAALAIDLYAGHIATTSETAMEYMRAVQDERALEIVLAAHEFLATDPRIRAPKRASIGWCFGGGWSLQTALHAPDLDAAVIYYGRLVTQPDTLKSIQASLLGIFANQDEGIPPEIVNEFDTALDTAGIEHRILRYDAHHAFANPSSARYDQEAASAAWAEVRTFLAKRLKP